jgi:hypothetical protein
MELWEILFVVLVLKIPLVYFGYVIWWAIKAEPEVGVSGGTEGLHLRPWRRDPSRSDRGRPSGGGLRRGGPRPTRRGRDRSRAT